MKIGVTIRNMGTESTAETMMACAKAAEDAGFESLWITDHIAIPPDDAEGSGGRYVDPLITLAWIAGATTGIKLGTGVLVLPYREALPTAKQVASLQELSSGRLLLGVGIGWMDAEFRALGRDRHERGRTSDHVLEIIDRCFADDVATLNGQDFLFKPRPPKPPILVGGAAPHALRRAARYGDGWLPMRLEPEAVSTAMRDYAAFAEEAGRPTGTITVMSGLRLGDPAAAEGRLAEYEEAGIDRFVCGIRYSSNDEYARQIEGLARIVR